MDLMPAPEPTSSPDTSCVWIIDGGPDAPDRPDAPEPTFVVAVDRGGRHALGLGLEVDVLIGDLDSIDADARELLVEQGVLVEQYPIDKDRSDLDLAIGFVAGLDPTRIDVVSAGGGRLDHSLVGALLLGRPDVAALPLTMHTRGTRTVAVAAGTSLQLDGSPGDTVTLLAVGAPARLDTGGLRWDLTSHTTLLPGASLGLSNVITEVRPLITVTEGVVLVVTVPA